MADTETEDDKALIEASRGGAPGTAADIHVPSGQWCPDDASPLMRLLMQNLGKVHVEWPPGSGRRALHEVLSAWGEGSRDALHQLAEHAIESLPAEIWLVEGGCGGEAVAAFWTEAAYHQAHRNVLRMFEAEDDPLWPIVERVPLIKR